MSPPVLGASLFGCTKGRKTCPVVAFGSPQGPNHDRTKYLFVRLLDVAKQDFCTQLLTIF